MHGIWVLRVRVVSVRIMRLRCTLQGWLDTICGQVVEIAAGNLRRCCAHHDRWCHVSAAVYQLDLLSKCSFDRTHTIAGNMFKFEQSSS